jgi:hypothetical protein
LKIIFLVFIITTQRTELSEMFCPNSHAASFSLIAFKMASNTPLLTISKVQREIRMAPFKSPSNIHFVNYFLDTTMESLGLYKTTDSWARYVFLRHYGLNVRDFYGIDDCNCNNLTHGCNYVIDFFDALYDDIMSDDSTEQLEAFKRITMPINPPPSDADLLQEIILSKYPQDAYWCFTAQDFMFVQPNPDTIPDLCKRMFSAPMPFNGPKARIVRNGIYARERIPLYNILAAINTEYEIPPLRRMMQHNLFDFDFRKVQRLSVNERERISGAIHAVNLWTALVSCNGSNGLFYELSRKYSSAFTLSARTTTAYFKRKMSLYEIRDELGPGGLGYIEITSPDLIEIRAPNFINDIIADIKAFIIKHFDTIMSKPPKSKIFIRGDLATVMHLPDILLIPHKKKADQYIMFDTM